MALRNKTQKNDRKRQQIHLKVFSELVLYRRHSRFVLYLRIEGYVAESFNYFKRHRLSVGIYSKSYIFLGPFLWEYGPETGTIHRA